MARAIVALCVTGLLAVSLLGFALPDGGLLSNRDLDVLVGGTDSSWCYRCLNCVTGFSCYVEEDDDCIGPGDCITRPAGMTPYHSNICHPEMGDEYCMPEGTEDILCKISTVCYCRKKPFPETGYFCDSDPTKGTVYVIPDAAADSESCEYMTPPTSGVSVDCT